MSAEIVVAGAVRTPIGRFGGGVTDGAAAIIVMAEDAARELGVQPLARIVDDQVDGVEPAMRSTWWSSTRRSRPR